METKHCSGCNETKARTEFGVYRSRPDKLNPRCKKCVRAYSNAQYMIHASEQRKMSCAGRKPMAVAKDRIKAVIGSPRTPEEIIELTKLDEDIVSDVLARMYGADEVKVTNRRFQLIAA